MSKDYSIIGRTLCYLLRHHPEKANLNMDKHGWVDVDELIQGVNQLEDFNLDKKTLKDIVEKDSKQRYTLDERYNKIRANQGHSINVDVELEKKNPKQEFLYHGTATRFEDEIDKKGLLPQTRLYVHLSSDIETATNVGQRHGKVIIYKIKCQEMIKDGYEFKISKNGVWLIENVPPKYLEKF